MICTQHVVTNQQENSLSHGFEKYLCTIILNFTPYFSLASMTLRKIVPKLFVIIVISILKKLKHATEFDHLELPSVLKERIKMKFMEILCVGDAVHYFLTQKKHHIPNTISFKEQPRVLIIAFTSYDEMSVPDVSYDVSYDVSRSSNTIFSAMALNPESPNLIFHKTRYSCELEYKLCAKNILSRAIELFQKFNQCDPQRIVIYQDLTGSDCVFNSIQSFSMENIIDDMVNPPQVHFISIQRDVTPLDAEFFPQETFVLHQRKIPRTVVKIPVLYILRNYNSDTKIHTLKCFTEAQCRHTVDNYNGKVPLIVVYLSTLQYYNREYQEDMTRMPFSGNFRRRSLAWLW